MPRSSFPVQITLDPASELARALAAADDTPVQLESEGVRYRVLRMETDHGNRERTERTRAALRRSFGILQGIDAETFKQDLGEQRAQDSSGRPA